MKNSLCKIASPAFVFFMVMVCWGVGQAPCVLAQLADSPWPTLAHDARHTGQSPYPGPATASLAWQYMLPAAGGFRSPVIDQQGTVIIPNGKGMVAINQDGTLRWENRDEYPGVGNCTPAMGSDGTIYATTGGNLFCAYKPDGTLKWSYEADTPFYYSSPNIGWNGTIYVGTNIDLLAISPAGKLLWKFRVGEEVDSAPAIANDGTIYVRARDYLYAVNPDGSLKWDLATGNSENQTYGSPAISNKDGTIYTYGAVESAYPGSYYGAIYAVKSDGTVKWTFSTYSWSFDPGSTTPAIASDGTLYVADPGDIYALNPDGTQKWVYTLPTGNYFGLSSPAIGKDGTIYIGTTGQGLCAINPDGSLKWKYDTIGDVKSSPAIGSDGSLYFSSTAGYLYAIRGFEQINPTPKILINGKSVIQILHPSDTCKITISLDPGSMTGQTVDREVLVMSSLGEFPMLQDEVPLFAIPETTIYDQPLTPGWYLFVFNVDNDPDGAFELEWYDYAPVIVLPK